MITVNPTSSTLLTEDIVFMDLDLDATAHDRLFGSAKTKNRNEKATTISCTNCLYIWHLIIIL